MVLIFLSLFLPGQNNISFARECTAPAALQRSDRLYQESLFQQTSYKSTLGRGTQVFLRGTEAVDRVDPAPLWMAPWLARAGCQLPGVEGKLQEPLGASLSGEETDLWSEQGPRASTPPETQLVHLSVCCGEQEKLGIRSGFEL